MHHLLLLHPGALGKFNVEHTHTQYPFGKDSHSIVFDLLNPFWWPPCLTCMIQLDPGQSYNFQFATFDFT